MHTIDAITVVPYLNQLFSFVDVYKQHTDTSYVVLL